VGKEEQNFNQQMTLLKVSAVCKQADDGFILNNISFSQRKLQKIAIAGETGSGKTTLLRIIAGLVQPDSGEVWFGNEKVKGPLDEVVPGHPDICYLSQDFELPNFLRVEQVLEYANTRSEEEAGILFEVCRITHLLNRKTDQLSGGERQRIAMARLLISYPKLLLLDEPFSNLDRVHKNILKSIIQDIGKRLRISVILISHDPEDILSWADKILVMKEGQLVQKGSPEKIYRQPVNEYTAGLFGNYNVIDPTNTLFPNLVQPTKNKKRMFVRPENIKIVFNRNKGIMGKVIDVNFCGCFYEIEVECSENAITVKTESGNFTKGDTVYVSFSEC